MKSKVLGLSIGIIVVLIGIIGLSYNSNNKNTFTQDGVTYALTLDGASINTFPSKGMYRADVKCTNASGKWLYDEWMLAIEDIISDNITCDIDFTTIEKTNLNDYIISLSGSKQGTGQVVDELNATVADYTNANPIAQSDYNSLTMYKDSSSSSTSGTANTNSFIFSGNSWSSVPNNLTSGDFYHIKFRPSTSGHYQVCYTMSSGHSSNLLYIFKGTSYRYINGKISLSASTDSSKEGCVDIGYVDTNTDVRIVQRAYSNSSYPIATIAFNLQKSTNAKSIDTGYRYEGKNPNNYIWFNNELWRIIGVFDENSHGESEQNLVKIIRNNSLGGLAWHKSNTNDWTTSSLMNLLNGVYLNAENGTDSGYCYGYSTEVPSNCDYTNTGINDTYRPMIENVTWYLGGNPSSNVTSEEFYLYERGYSGRSTEWEGKIGLMYPSDYGYSVLARSCARTTNLGDYDTAICGAKSWLYGQGYEWTITLNTPSGGFAFYLDEQGNLSSVDRTVNFGYGVRPVLYLNSSVYVIDGNGSQADPYIIGI